MRPTKKQKALGEEWGWGEFEIEHGYGIFQNGNGPTHIERIDDMETFASDMSAVRQAKKDGFKFLFTNVLDTPENREITKNWSKEEKEEWL